MWWWRWGAWLNELTDGLEAGSKLLLVVLRGNGWARYPHSIAWITVYMICCTLRDRSLGIPPRFQVKLMGKTDLNPVRFRVVDTKLKKTWKTTQSVTDENGWKPYPSSQETAKMVLTYFRNMRLSVSREEVLTDKPWTVHVHGVHAWDRMLLSAKIYSLFLLPVQNPHSSFVHDWQAGNRQLQKRKNVLAAVNLKKTFVLIYTNALLEILTPA